jgi:hypothetical protein
MGRPDDAVLQSEALSLYTDWHWTSKAPPIVLRARVSASRCACGPRAGETVVVVGQGEEARWTWWWIAARPWDVHLKTVMACVPVPGEAGKRVEKTRGFDASPRAALISWGHGGVLALGTARIRAVRRMGHSFERVLLNPSSGRRPGSGATTWYAAS